MRKFIVNLYNFCDKIMNKSTENEDERLPAYKRNQQLTPNP